MGTPGTPNIENFDPRGAPSFLIPIFLKSASNFPITFIYLPHTLKYRHHESESVGSSDDEVTFSLLRFPVVNIKQ
jgi:hypothetical protein